MDWIDINDRKPTTTDDVLIAYTTKYGDYYVGCGFYGTSGKWMHANDDMDMDYYKDTVTHWMSLHKYPKL